MTTPTAAHTAQLSCHPETYSPVVTGIQARVWWTQERALAVAFVLTGDLTRLRIPTARPPRRADHLWQHTCFEVFVSVKGRPAYHEYNFAPSGEWAAYAFRRYREGAPLADAELAPNITVRRIGDSLALDAIVRLGRLRAIEPQLPLGLALSAVVEVEGGTLSYWALKHPPGKPDFHHEDGFALELPPPD